MSQLNFSINFCPIKMYLSGNTLWPQNGRILAFLWTFVVKWDFFVFFKHRASLHFWDGNPLKSLRENCTWRFFNFYFTLCRTVHQWLITRIPMGRWVRIPFQLCHKENHVGNFVYNSRHAMSFRGTRRLFTADY